MSVYCSTMAQRVAKYSVFIGALVFFTIAHADSETPCQQCFRYCSSVRTTDACTDQCYDKICEPVPINFTDWED